MSAGSDAPRVPSSRSSPLQSQPPAIPDHELIRCIGQGSYGEVWLARNKLGTLRAVKIVYRQSFEDSRPFEREFKGIQKFEPISRSHEGLVDILQVGGGEDYFYYVMELADDAAAKRRKWESGQSENLEDRPFSPRSTFPICLTMLPATSPAPSAAKCAASAVCPVAQCLEIGQSLASALAHLHAHGLVHRDIKPSNIIFVHGAPKLADIGLVADVERSALVCRHGRFHSAGRAGHAASRSLQPGQSALRNQHGPGPARFPRFAR